MVDVNARRALAQRMEEIAGTVIPDAIEAEMGPMCMRSFFQLVHQGAPVTQGDVDGASQAFSRLTERLLPPGVVHRFVEQACAMRLLPESGYGDLVPGYTEDESIAGADAATRRTSPMKKFTEQEILACLAWNQREPRILVALAHLIQLLETYIETVRHMVGRHSPEAAEKLVPYARQWAPKNVLKFVNVALFVAGTRRSGGAAFEVDQALIEEAMNLLNHSGAFTWEAAIDSSIPRSAVDRIHCPAHGFLHRLLAQEGTLMTVIAFVTAEAARKPPAPEIKKSLAFMEQRAISEETGIRTFGQEWSRMKLEA